LNGASGFLAKNTRGEIFYATAAHLLGINGGVKPEIPQSSLNSVLESWIAHPRTLEDSVVYITSLAGAPSNDLNNDWALLCIDQSEGELPSEPLKFRKKRVDVGEKVFLIGVPYSEPNKSQNVYTGIVTAREHNDRFRFDLSPPVDIRGFSGAPIIDSAGYAVGVMTIWFETKMAGGKDLEAGGEDAAAVYDRLETATP
jgi:S1-C subfamily serine protease